MTSSVLSPTSSFLLFLVINVMLASIPLSTVTADEFFKQPAESKTTVKRSTSGESKPPRLLELIEMRDAVSSMLPVDDTPSLTRNFDGTSGVGDGLQAGGSQVPRLFKRVFCNGFTGCGGRFRGRRRQLNEALGKRRLSQQRVGKRPFCNTLGCYNGGRKRHEEEEVESAKVEEQLKELVSTSSRLPVLSPRGGWNLDEKVKRLFCNGYGGCQNGGKRWGKSGMGTKQTGASSRNLALPLSDESLKKLSTMKRFFAGGYDNDMEGLIDSLKR
uniref:CCAP-1 n=1 Tax=Aplysia californica TaxID=6500 RepID=A0A161A2B2_APLCA|nr:CCAP-1 [Aplysia californica]